MNDHIGAIVLVLIAAAVYIGIKRDLRRHPTRPSERDHRLPGALVPRGDIEPAYLTAVYEAVVEKRTP